MITDFNSKISIISALNLSWNYNDSAVKGRPFHALSVRVKGNGTVSQGNKTEQLKTGTIMFMPEGVDYYINTKEEQIFVIHFLAEDVKEQTFKVFNPQNAEHFLGLFSRFYHAFTTKTTGYEYKCLSIFYEILYNIEKTCSPELSSDYKKIKNAVDYIHLNFTNPELSIKELCKMSFFSDTYFRNLFYSQFKTTPLAYITDLRISHAQALLGETDYTISKISLLSGFFDEKYFCKVFKKKTGKTPTEFRNNN